MRIESIRGGLARLGWAVLVAVLAAPQVVWCQDPDESITAAPGRAEGEGVELVQPGIEAAPAP